MGLDMSLWAKKYVSGRINSFVYPTELQSFQNDDTNCKFKTYKVGYWRKFNALHAYIVDRFADGEDNCQTIYLQATDLEEILDICKQIQADHSKAPELLPTRDGFFFGTTDYGEWYFWQIDKTVELLTKLLVPEITDIYDFEYDASW